MAGSLFIFAVAFAYGPALSIANERLRTAPGHRSQPLGAAGGEDHPHTRPRRRAVAGPRGGLRLRPGPGRAPRHRVRQCPLPQPPDPVVRIPHRQRDDTATVRPPVHTMGFTSRGPLPLPGEHVELVAKDRDPEVPRTFRPAVREQSHQEPIRQKPRHEGQSGTWDGSVSTGQVTSRIKFCSPTSLNPSMPPARHDDREELPTTSR